MIEKVEEGFMAFLSDGAEGIGAVRMVSRGGISLYVENFGEFTVPASAITDVHSSKVMLDESRLGPALRAAIRHRSQAEDPKLVG